MLFSQRIPKADELATCVFCVIGSLHTVMQVNLNFTPPRLTMLSQTGHQPTIILFCGVKISMHKRAPLAVAPIIGCARVCATPGLNPALLFIIEGASE